MVNFWKKPGKQRSLSLLCTANEGFLRIAACGAQKYPEQKNNWAARVLEKVRSLPPQLRAFSLQEVISRWALLDWEQAEQWISEIGRNFSTPEPIP